MKKQKTNWVLTIVLILGTLTVFFPLYMAVIIAFKKPSEMTNDVAGALSFPSKWSFSNFTEAMKVTDFWHSLGNSLLITIVTIVLAILIHSIAGYVIGRGMARFKVPIMDAIGGGNFEQDAWLTLDWANAKKTSDDVPNVPIKNGLKEL